MNGRVLHFTRDGEPVRFEVNSPQADRIFMLVAKFQELERWYPTQARIIEETVDDIIKGNHHACR